MTFAKKKEKKVWHSTISFNVEDVITTVVKPRTSMADLYIYIRVSWYTGSAFYCLVPPDNIKMPNL